MSTTNWIERSEFASAARIDNRSRILTLTVGAGSGAECAYCHKSIDAESVEHTVEAVVLSGMRVLHFHRVCQHLWEISSAS